MKTVSERNLYNIVKERFPDAEFQKKFDWLGQLNLDVYIPSKKQPLNTKANNIFVLLKPRSGLFSRNCQMYLK